MTSKPSSTGALTLVVDASDACPQRKYVYFQFFDVWHEK
jgi:hypothetical protein